MTDPIETSEILDIATYESIRGDYRDRILAHKQQRRIAVGDRVTLTFEDRETVRYQIQEMTRIEQIREPAGIEHEVRVYNALLPGPETLSATLFIEIAEQGRVRAELDRLVGIDACVAIEIGEGPEATRFAARFDEEQLEEDRISAVHYVRFPLGAAGVRRLAAGEPARLVISHPNYRAEAEIGDPLRASLLRDLSGDSPVLLELEKIAPVPEREDRVIEETETIRIVRPARALRQHHVIIEPKSALRSIVDADRELAASLFEAARRVARDFAADGITTRIVCEVDPRGDQPVRIQVVSAGH